MVVDLASTPIVVTIILGVVGLAIPVIDALKKREGLIIDFIVELRLELLPYR